MLFGRGKKSKDERPDTAGTVEESGAEAPRPESGRARHQPAISGLQKVPWI